VDGGWDAGTGARGMLDGNLLMRWGELGERGRREGLGKYGEGEEGSWLFWGEREVLCGWGVFGGRGR
jgi:cleavage and polyadenylation specificity factor subunit 1